MKILIVILIILAIIVAVWYVVTYNGFVRERNRIEEAFATMDVYLKKRWDLVPNLLSVVKAYSEHETDTINRLAELRDQAYDSMSVDEKFAANRQLVDGINKLFASAETLPDLKTNTNYLQLSNQLNQIESDIANSRKYYNAVVRDMNTKVESFPSSLVANRFYFQKWKMFELDDAQERRDVKVQF